MLRFGLEVLKGFGLATRTNPERTRPIGGQHHASSEDLLVGRRGYIIQFIRDT